MDMGDFVVVVNADKLVVTGKKSSRNCIDAIQGLSERFARGSFERMMATHPERVLEKAVRGMLPEEFTRACDVPQT